MKPEEIRDLSDEELEQKIKENKIELFNMRFQLTTGQLDNPLKIRQVRKDIARFLTASRHRELNPSEQKPKIEMQKTKKGKKSQPERKAKQTKKTV